MSFTYFISHQTLVCLLLLLLGISNEIVQDEQHQTYIIHMDHSHKPATFSTHKSWHHSILKSLSKPVDEEMILYSYNYVMHGFSAKLTASQLDEIEKSPAHVGTYQESFGKLFTTHSPEFLGLQYQSGIWPTASYGEGVIIGVIDTGIWPDSESFGDMGMPPVPQRWKGQCENGTAFSLSNCNRKLIGARSFSKGLIAAGRNISSKDDYDSARDYFGHGTHTSSTAAGNYVSGVSHFGYARGTARGVAPHAHIAMYKVLFATDTYESAATDVLAGMDKAIEDGVDIMSISLGFDQTPYFNDVVAIASLSAIEREILVVCAAGNDGAYNSTYNGAPWIITVGAGTIDRIFTATLTLSNGQTVEGTSFYPENIYISDAPFYYSTNESKAICNYNSLNKSEVHGHVVICDSSFKIDIEGQMQELERVGAYAGVLMSVPPITLFPEDYNIPSLVIPPATGASLKNVVQKSKIKATMRFINTKIGTKAAPKVAYFSSRGPDPITPGVLKPDIIAPGADVLAAFIPTNPLNVIGKYSLVTDYALLSGTSMAAPHVAGVAALLKNIFPEWSPAAIRSAIMTTANTKDNRKATISDELTGLSATPLGFGAGHIDPNKAMNPGLIYDIAFQDYIDFICSLNYTEKQISAVLRRSQWNCSSEKTNELNYPSFIATLTNKTNFPATFNFSRVVTNVGNDVSIYQPQLEVPAGMKITVEPTSLSFSRKYDKQRFSVAVAIDKDAPKVVYAYLKWVDQHNHVVSSPIVAVNF